MAPIETTDGHSLWNRLVCGLRTCSSDAVLSCIGFISGGLLFPFVYCLSSNDHIVFHSIVYTVLYPALSIPILSLVISYCLQIGTKTGHCDPRQNVWSAFFLGYSVGLGLLLCATSLSLQQYRVFWPFGSYLILLGFFHWSEFLFTAIFNPFRCSIDIYMLDHSPEYLIALLSSVVEYWIETLFVDFYAISWSTPIWLRLSGLFICFLGEVLRKTAILTARTNFDHFVEVSRRPEHVLITHGVYSWVRHPAYVGWFYWAIGTQVLLGNPICLVAYAFACHSFFRARIEFEEMHLLRFFGTDYVRYQNTVPVGIPFVSGYKTQRSVNHVPPHAPVPSG